MPQHSLAVVPANPAELIREVIKSGLNSESVGVVERLVALAERQEARQAEKDFNAAFNALQAEMPSVVADREVPDKQGNLKYKFAAFEDIMAQVKPLLLKHGFSVSFSMDFRDGRVIQQCTLSHSGGHSRTNTFMARPGSGPPGSSEAQGDGAASTYAKRFALCNALNIVVERDTDGADARNEGKPISADQALCLRDLVKQTKSNESAFLKFAGAATFEEIGSARYDQLFQALNKKLAGL
jgi:hypothetical protein